MKSLIKSKADLLIIALCLLGLALIAPATTQYSRLLSMRPQCATNLSRIGKAMLIYANDYDDELPKAGNRTNDWTYQLPDWKAMNRYDAYDITNIASRGKVTVSSSLYLLIKYAEVTPKEFICPGDRMGQEFKLSNTGSGVAPNTRLFDLWDFGPWIDPEHNPSSHCSYAYHWPLDAYALTIRSDPATAVAADRNPWMDPNRVNDPYAGWNRFNPDANDPDVIKLGNSDNHLWQGQNVLFLDMHIRFATTPNCGLNNDNIYTAQDPNLTLAQGSLAKGRKPAVYTNACQPTSKEDSVLIQEYGKNPNIPSP